MAREERRESVVTFLEMRTPRGATRPWPGAGFRIERVASPSLRFYRYLYDVVGAEWHWVDRKVMPDAELEEILTHPDVEVHVLSEGGIPIGYGELDRRSERSVQIAYFGLAPEGIGRGLGRWFLEQMNARAWRSWPERVWVRTCDLDHPRALANYEAAGFRVYARRLEALLIKPSAPSA